MILVGKLYSAEEAELTWRTFIKYSIHLSPCLYHTSSSDLKDLNQTYPINTKSLTALLGRTNRASFRELFAVGTMNFPERQERAKRTRKHNTICFNPKFNQNVTTNVAKKFLSFIDKHFPRNHCYHKLFNQNTVICSYSCMSNMKAIINSHNSTVLADGPENNPRQCNCRAPQNCPLNGHCLTECVVCRATVSGPQAATCHYNGQIEGLFKTRYYAHTKSFRDVNHRLDTELSKHVWNLKDQQKVYSVKWSIMQQAKRGLRRWDVCPTEKTVIATADTATILNKRSQLASAWRHQAKFRFKNLADHLT